MSNTEFLTLYFKKLLPFFLNFKRFMCTSFPLLIVLATRKQLFDFFFL